MSTRQGIDLSHLPGIQPQTLRSWVLILYLAYKELSCELSHYWAHEKSSTHNSCNKGEIK